MRLSAMVAALGLLAACSTTSSQTRVWTDLSGTPIAGNPAMVQKAEQARFDCNLVVAQAYPGTGQPSTSITVQQSVTIQPNPTPIPLQGRPLVLPPPPQSISPAQMQMMNTLFESCMASKGYRLIPTR